MASFEKVIFLDIDGVLNAIDKQYDDREHAIDDDAIARVNRLGETTGAVVVITSSWRLFYSWPKCRDILLAFGLAIEVVDETHDLWDVNEEPEPGRRREIEEWLARHAVERYVVLDDMELFPESDSRFVQTDQYVGLTDGDVERAISVLSSG